MHKDIFLVGRGQTRFGEWWEKSVTDLVDEAIRACIDASPCTSLDVDMVIVANMLADRTNGQSQMGALASSLLPHHPPALRVEAACASGAVALHTACALLESGRVQTILVVGVEKMTDRSVEEISAGLMGAADSEKDAPSGLTFPGIFGLVASRYMHEYGLTREELSVVSAVHHAHAKENPFAQFRSAILPEAVSASPLVADPLRMLDCSPITDGAAAVLLSTREKSGLRLRASALATDTLSIADRPTITSFSATKEAREQALREAEISLEDIQCVELHDCFSIAALVSLEDLGFANAGEGIQVYKNLWEHPQKSSVSINASGGLKACGHPVAATGVKQLIDVSKEMEKREATFGMTHNFGGAGATCAIHILERSS